LFEAEILNLFPVPATWTTSRKGWPESSSLRVSVETEKTKKIIFKGKRNLPMPVKS
jgi:hypothetical protein